nr:MAG TPA: hypothetical protein [Caudoviricetes sp.]DAZ29237.1 MAG TPA: hypothetical protein [Caudoviricetes sp.]
MLNLVSTNPDTRKDLFSRNISRITLKIEM